MRQRVSRTATVVALWRARESARSASTRLFEDPFAEAFVGWRLRCALQLSRLPLVGAALPWSLVDGHWDGSRGTASVRTRYIDDALGGALRNGVEQVVVLGAGFDLSLLSPVKSPLCPVRSPTGGDGRVARRPLPAL